MFIRKFPLFNQHLSDGGGSGGGGGETTNNTTIKTDVVQMKPSPSSGKPNPPAEVPESVKNQTFSVEDFETEQLPTHSKSADEEKTEKQKTTIDNTTEEPISKENKSAEDVDKEAVEKEKKKETEEIAETTDKEEKKLPSFIKAPAGKEQKTVTTTKSDKQSQAPNKITRDYSGHTADEIAVFKKMSDDAYVFTKKLINQNKELQNQTQTNYFQDENAYTLHPEFRKTQTDAHFYSKEAEYLRQQLINIKQGKPWHPLIKWDDNGNPVIGAERQPSEGDEEAVRMAMSQCINAVQQSKTKLAEFPIHYKNRIAQDMVAIDNECKKQFIWEANPEYLEYSVDMGEKMMTFKEIRDEFIGLFPPYMRSHPAARVAGNMMIALRIANGEIEELKNSLSSNAVKVQEKQRVEPTSKVKPAKKDLQKIHGVSEFVDDGMVL